MHLGTGHTFFTGSRQGIPHVPSSMDPVSEALIRQGHPFCPFNHRQCLSLKRKPMVTAHIPGLFFTSAPPAILATVSQVIIDSVDAVVRRWPVPHISYEARKITPLRADGDAATTIAIVTIMFRVLATLVHRVPDGKFRRMIGVFARREPVRRRPESELFACPTPAGCLATQEASASYRKRRPAFALADPFDATVGGPHRIFAQYGQAAVGGSSRDDNLRGHQAYSWCQAPGVSARRGHFLSLFYHIFNTPAPTATQPAPPAQVPRSRP